MTDERNFELAQIYDDDWVLVYRLESEALSIFGNRSVCVVRPWHWRPIDQKAFEEPPSHVREGLLKMQSAPEEWSGSVSLGDLVLWSSRRSKLHDWHPPDDDDAPMFIVARASIDAQRVGGRIFNRRLIREAVQAFIEDWAEGEEERDVCLTIKSLGGGAVLCMAWNGIHAYVMCLSDSVTAGSERMPTRKCECQWEAGDSPCPVHGDVDG